MVTRRSLKQRREERKKSSRQTKQTNKQTNKQTTFKATRTCIFTELIVAPFGTDKLANSKLGEKVVEDPYQNASKLSRSRKEGHVSTVDTACRTFVTADAGAGPAVSNTTSESKKHTEIGDRGLAAPQQSSLDLLVEDIFVYQVLVSFASTDMRL